MSEVKVEHRQMMLLRYGALCDVLPGHAAFSWVESGEATTQGTMRLGILARDFAEAESEAEARGYAKCRDDVIAVLYKRAEAERDAFEAFCMEHMSRGMISADEHPGELRADAFDDVRAEILRNEHIGASDKREGE